MTYEEFKAQVTANLGSNPDPSGFDKCTEDYFMYTSCTTQYSWYVARPKPWIYSTGFAVGTGATLPEAKHNARVMHTTHFLTKDGTLVQTLQSGTEYIADISNVISVTQLKDHLKNWLPVLIVLVEG